MDILKYRIPIILLAVAALATSLYFIPNLKADYNFENFFPKGDTSVQYFNRYQEDFSTNDQLLMLAIVNHPTVFETNFLHRLDSLSKGLQAQKSIERVLSLTNASTYKKTPFGIVEIPLVKFPSDDYTRARKKIMEDPRMVDLLISEDARITALLIEVKKGLRERQEDTLLQQLYSLCDQLEFEEYHLGGRIYTQASYIRMLEAENVRLIPMFMLMVVLVLLVLYRSFISIIVPTFSVMIGLIFLYGYAAAIGRSINLATLMYPTIMAVVGMSDLIHLYTKYQLELDLGHDRRQAILNSLKELRVTLLLTSLTTIIGFLTISRSLIPHIKTFGIDGAVGVFMAYVIAITLTPVMLSYLPASRTEQSRINWSGICDWIYRITKTREKQILGIAAICLLIAVWGMSLVDTNNFALGAIDDRTKLKQDFLFFEKELSGVRSFEMGVEVLGEQSITDFEVLQALDSLEQYLETIPTLGTVFSPLTFYKSAYAIEKGDWANYRLPPTEQEKNKLERWRKRIKLPYTSEDQKRGRFTARMQDLGRLKVKEIITDIQNWIDKNLANSSLKFGFTGASLLIDKTNELMIDQMIWSLLLAFFLVSLIVAWLFRKLKMVLISLLPNILPLLLTAGVMGFFGVELNGSTAIIFTIAFVIAVDDTIHFLMKFQKELQIQGDLEKAIQSTLAQAGKAIIITSLVLSSGYFILFFSDFKEAWYHGVLICFTLIWALLADLFLIPILLRRFFGKI